jgi:hypothetical protein
LCVGPGGVGQLLHRAAGKLLGASPELFQIGSGRGDDLVERVPRLAFPGYRRARHVGPDEHHDDNRHDYADNRRDVRPESLDCDFEPLGQGVSFQLMAVRGFHFWLSSPGFLTPDSSEV